MTSFLKLSRDLLIYQLLLMVSILIGITNQATAVEMVETVGRAVIQSDQGAENARMLALEEALYLAAARLPRLAVEPWEADMPILGKDTVSAMHSGIFWGYVSMVEGLIERLRRDYGAQLPVIATGGLAPLFADHVASISIVDPDLTLKGLVRIHAQNKR